MKMKPHLYSYWPNEKPPQPPKGGAKAAGQDQSLFLSTENKSSIEKESPAIIPPAGKLNTANPEQLVYETNELIITIWGGISTDRIYAQ